jgi:hypothetical protein
MHQAPLSPKEENEVRSLLARGTTKSAVERAKEIHKRYHSPASEALLIDAYAARIRSLEEHALTAEAKALFDLVRERYPAAKQKLAELSGFLASSQSGIEDLVRPLNDPGISSERRAEIEDFIKRHVTDLSVLAQCKVLSPSHPLRAGAAALTKCFEAVTNGPVTDGDLLLPEVPRRGALAPWKMVVRAIAYFYQRDDARCEQCLQAIDPDSVPARFVPAIRAMLSENPEQPLKPASAALINQVSGNTKALRSALEALDVALKKRKKRAQILTAIQNAVSACRRGRPDMLDRLRQHITVRTASLNLHAASVTSALGALPVRDAYFSRLFARTAETSMEVTVACAMWEEFLRHAIAEGWFAEHGPEAAALYLHMAELLCRTPAEELKAERADFIATSPDLNHHNEDRPLRSSEGKRNTHDFYFLFPERLFELACAMDPHREAFEQWLDWAESRTDRKKAEQAAESWHRALPKDSQPLLYLMEAAENRGALKKAFTFLEEAEKLDSLNPEVRRAALRLLVGQAVRHSRQRKAHLLEQDLAGLERLPQAQEGDRPAFLAALRWTCCVIRQELEPALNHFASIAGLLETPASAILACGGLGEACGFRSNELGVYLDAKHVPGKAEGRGIFRALADAILSRNPLPENAGSIAGAVARACALGDDMGVPFTIPPDWENGIVKELSNAQNRLQARELRTLGEAALRRDRRELAYACSAAGLAKGSDTEGRFMLLRARALPEWEFQRRAECIAAAAELGRRRRDMDLVDEAVDLARGRRRRRRSFFGWIDDIDHNVISLTGEKLNAVLQREKQSAKFPVFKGVPFREPVRNDPFPAADWDDSTDEEEEFQEEVAFGQLLEELRQVFEGKQPKAMPKKPRKSISPDVSDQGDLPF